MSAGLAFTSNPIVAQKSRSRRSTPRSVIASASSVYAMRAFCSAFASS